MSLSDSNLNAQLQAVTVPDGLLDRLRAVVFEDDDGLDATLREVAVPAGLIKRLHAIPLADDDGLDEALRNVPVPLGLTASWRRSRQFGDRVMRFSRLATAASLIIAVSLSYFSAMILSLAVSRSTEVTKTEPDSNAVPAPEPLQALKDTWANQPLEEPRAAVPLASPPKVGLARVEPRHPRGAEELGTGLNMPQRADPLLMPELYHGIAPNQFDDLPELPRRVANLVPRGLDWPLVPGSNSAFLIRYGLHPFVSPAAHAKLQTCPVPLGIDASSYELARRYAEENLLPPPEMVRTEDFLQAVDYEYPKPTKQNLGLIMAAGPSPISGEGFCLLQVGVQARQITDDKHPPAQLVFLVDTSTSMRWGSRIELIRRAMRDISHRLQPADRLSLVSFNQAAHVLVQSVGPESMAQFDAAVESLTAEGSTDVAVGLREAFSLVQRFGGQGRPPVRVVLLTDGLLELADTVVQRIEHEVSEASGRGIPLHVIDLGQQNEGDPQLAAFAKAGHGTVHRAVNTDQVHSAIREILTGRSQLMARGALLQVTFNPKTVLEYRLLGHETRWAGMLPGPLEGDFGEGQSRTALYEVRLATTGPSEVATAEVTWLQPGDKQPTGKHHKATAHLLRKDFASSLMGSALSLQEAGVVAYTAEALRKSPFLSRNQRLPLSTAQALVRAFELAGQVDSRLNQRPSFAEFALFIQQEIKAKPAPANGRRP